MPELFRQNETLPLFLPVLRAFGWKVENLRLVRRFVPARRVALSRRVFRQLKFERIQIEKILKILCRLPSQFFHRNFIKIS